MTRISAFLLMCAVTGWGQTTKPTPKPDDTGTLAICDDKHPCVVAGSNFTFHGDDHCGFLGTWDDGRQQCAISVTFTAETPTITCSPVTKDENGTQRMVCWYKPVPSTGGK